MMSENRLAVCVDALVSLVVVNIWLCGGQEDFFYEWYW
jgi:hypothetical protein